MPCNKIVSKFLIGGSDTLRIEERAVTCENGIVTRGTDDSSLKYIDKGVIIPAFFNMHSHLGESVFRNISGNDWTLQKYLEYTESYNLALSKDEKDKVWKESAKYSIEQMYKQGTIGFCAARSSNAAKQLNMLVMSGFPIMNSPKLAYIKSLGIQGFRSFYNNNDSDECKTGIFLHSVYLNDESSFLLAKQCLEEGAAFITVHISEDSATEKLERGRFGMSAVELLNSYGLLSSKSILVHCGYCSDDDLRLIKEKGALVCACPVSNKFLNTKMPDLYTLETMGIPWCITTDGLATGRSFSLLEQIRCAMESYPRIPLSRYWESITTVPAQYFGSPLYSGTICDGVRSSFLLTDYKGHDWRELIENLIKGNIGFEPIMV